MNADQKKRVYILGYPVAHSVSPAMQNAAFRALGMDWEYERLETEHAKLRESIAKIREENCAGANVTIPHKETVIEFLNDVTPAARRIGAVNTIVKRDGRLIGDNTDAYGFYCALQDALVEMRGARVGLIGAGGAARAVAFALGDAGAASIAIWNRTATRAELLAQDLQGFAGMKIFVNDLDAFQNATLIVNATSVGMSPRVAESPLPRGIAIPRDTVVCDLVYRPARTRLIQEAERVAARTIGGMGMLVHQGARAFELWTGCVAPVEVMLRAAQEALRNS